MRPRAKHCIDSRSPVTCRMEHPHSAGLVWIWTIFTLPTVLVLVGNHPDVQVTTGCKSVTNFDMLRNLRNVVWGYGWCCIIAGFDSVGNWFQEWFIRPENLDTLDVEDSSSKLSFTVTAAWPLRLRQYKPVEYPPQSDTWKIDRLQLEVILDGSYAG